jgi:hypothetical protein
MQQDEDVRVGVDRFPGQQPIGTAASELDRDYQEPLRRPSSTPRSCRRGPSTARASPSSWPRSCSST